MADYLLNTIPDSRRDKSMVGIFCATCEVNFCDDIEHKNHYKSDLHAFNLKRKVLQLKPVSLELFEKSLKEIMEKQRLEQTKTQQKEERKYCDFCWKEFSSAKTFTEHLKSKKHIENEKTKRAKIEPAKVELTTKDDLSVCLFCNFKSESIDSLIYKQLNSHAQQTQLFHLR